MTESETLDAIERFAREQPSRARRSPKVDRSQPQATLRAWLAFFESIDARRRPEALVANIKGAIR